MSTVSQSDRSQKTKPASRIELPAGTAAGQARVVIESISPAVDEGRFPAKRVEGDTVVVEVDIINDGHDQPSGVLLYRSADDAEWQQVPLSALVNDRWTASFTVEKIGTYYYTVEAWIDHFKTWRYDFNKRVAAGQDVGVDLQIGAEFVALAVEHAKSGADQEELKWWLGLFQAATPNPHLEAICHDRRLDELMWSHGPRKYVTRYEREFALTVDRRKAQFSTWYELFPRSAAAQPGRHGTFDDVIARLPYVAYMGFDVLYLPPIHPIGQAHRKGPNNNPVAQPGDVGSPWAIGAKEGGHKAILPELGTFDDFARLVSAAAEQGIELALDIAFQCSPDHPWVKEHPAWFKHRPDGTIQYAENPPKKYQDIYPINFESEDWEALWQELKSVFTFWIERDVKIFRVDNPHTKSFPFWEWCIGELKREHPEVILLAEAFTRPKLMYRLAKVGYSQSYTYFAWRHAKAELTEYMRELTTPPVSDFFRPNFWPNTPDILTEYLQHGGRPAFMNRLVLAATLTASYGIYGPPYEHFWGAPRDPGSEEYLNSEKYEIRHHDIERADSMRDFIARVNQIRKEHPALQSNERLQFHPIENDQLIAYSKRSADGNELLLMVVNLDPHNTHGGFLELPLAELGIEVSHPYQLHDVLSDARFLWHGPRNYVELNPHVVPAHIFRIGRRVRFDVYFEFFL